VDKSLVEADPSGSSSRFRLLEMIRDYTWDRLAESGEAEEVARRHGGYFQAFAAAADRGLRGPDEVVWTERIERDLDNLRAAVNWAVEAGEVDMALGVVASLATGFGTTIGAPFGPLAERAAAMPEALFHPLRCVTLASAARSARDRGDSDRAALLADSALEAVVALPPGPANARARCRTFSGVSIIRAHQQDTARLREEFEDRLAAAMELGDPWELVYARFGRLPVLRLSDPSRAIIEGEENLRLARQLANPSMLAYATMLSATLIAQSDSIRAEALLEESIGIAGAMRNDFAEIQARRRLGVVRARRGDHLRAADAFLAATDLASRVGDRLSVFDTLGALACDLAELGHHEQALLLAAWAAMRGHWPEDWSRSPAFPDSPALARLRAEMSPEQRQQLAGQAGAINDAEAIALARASLEALSRTDP
jgi:hypothetical protein